MMINKRSPKGNKGLESYEALADAAKKDLNPFSRKH
jgi:hypothetical protein